MPLTIILLDLTCARGIKGRPGLGSNVPTGPQGNEVISQIGEFQKPSREIILRVQVDKNDVAGDDVKIKQVVIRDYALATLVRPYENLKNTYKRIFTEGLSGINRSSFTGPVIEIYKNDPKSTPPKKLITQICVIVKP